jgi:glycosyltransferase involved in cell wall biosynthesis
MARQLVTAVVPTFNEAANIVECLQGLQWADEILVVDSFSTDGTPELARPLCTRLVQHAYASSAAQKNWIIPQASHPWVFMVDADERCPPALAAEVQRTLEAPARDGYWIHRRTWFMGRELRHSGLDTDRVVRLFRRELRYADLQVHAEVRVPSGRSGRLRERLLHFSIDNLDQFFEKRLRYARWGARDLVRQGRRAGPGTALVHGLFAFVQQYLLRRGFLDGAHGLAHAWLSALYTSAKYLCAWELQLPHDARRAIRRQGLAAPSLAGR